MSKMEILKFLIENKKTSYTINEISKILNISYKVTYETIQKFKINNLILLKKVGHSSQIKFNPVFNESTYIAEIQRKEQLIKNKYICNITKKLSSINNPFFIALVFGSYAKRTNTKNSDIDICIISDNDKIFIQIEKELNLLPIEIDLQTFTTSQFQSMINTTQENVGKEIIENNVILEGIENYYKLIQTQQIKND